MTFRNLKQRANLGLSFSAAPVLAAAFLVFRFHPAVLDAAHEVKDEEAEQGDEEGEENLARARDEADRAGEPDASARGQPAHMPARLQDGACTEKGDAGHDRLDGAQGVEIEIRPVIGKAHGKFDTADDEGGRGQRHQHAGAQARRFLPQLPFEPDQSAEHEGGDCA